MMALGPIPIPIGKDEKNVTLEVYSDPLGLGGEATVYGAVKEENGEEIAVKIFEDIQRAGSLQDKIKILANYKRLGKIPDNVVAPLGLIFSNDNEGHFRGFKMQLLKDSNPISMFRWENSIGNNQIELFDEIVANLLFDLSDSIEELHTNHIILGDLKPGNLLVSNRRAYIIDFDSCSLADYPSNDVFTLEYVDPLIRGDNPEALGPFQFSPKSDWWALAVVAFQLFLGISPWGGMHPKYKNAKSRSFYYSVAGFDPNVRTPDKLRPLTWLNNKPKLKAYFTNIFSPDSSKRFSIKHALEPYFSRVPIQIRKENTKLTSLFTSLKADQQEYLVNVIRKLELISLNKISNRREEERNKFIEALLGLHQ